jgi:hypothetical protein
MVPAVSIWRQSILRIGAMHRREGSPRFRLAREDVKKVFKGAGINALGAVLAYFASLAASHSEATTSITTLILCTVFSALFNALRKFLTNTQQTVLK